MKQRVLEILKTEIPETRKQADKLKARIKNRGADCSAHMRAADETSLKVLLKKLRELDAEWRKLAMERRYDKEAA